MIEVIDGERLAMVTELVDGPNLGEWMLGGPFSASTLTLVFAGILNGVEAAHARGWVHRDLKPANILLEPTDPPLARVADFGLAYLACTTRLTRSGSMLGTPSYMAPEQVRDPSQVDPRVDLFALGAILFEMWCNRPAFSIPDVAGALQASSAGLYPNPRLLRPDMPENVAIAIAGALEPDPSARIPDCATLRAVLEGRRTWQLRVQQSAPTTLAELGGPPEAPPSPQSRRWLAFGGLAGVGVAAAGVALLAGAPSPHLLPMVTLEPVYDTESLDGILLRVDGLQAQGRWDGAHAMANRALALEPELPAALLARARARAAVGDLEAARVDFGAAKAKTIGADRLLVILEEAEVELGFGQVERPFDLLRRASEGAERDGRWADVVKVQTLLGWMAWYLRDAEQLVRSQAVLQRAVENVELGRPERNMLRAHEAYLGGLAGVVRGDAEAIYESRSTLESLGVAYFADVNVATSVRVLAAYEMAFGGDSDGLFEVALAWDFCEAQADGGELLWGMGLHAKAVERLNQATATCGVLGTERLFQYIAVQGLALEAARVGDAEAEAQHRAELHRLWPSPEASHPRVTVVGVDPSSHAGHTPEPESHSGP